MGRRQYPILGSRKVRKRRLPCELCNRVRAGYTIVVQVDWFRGDDDVYDVCGRCSSRFQSIYDKHGDRSACCWLQNQYTAHHEAEKEE